MNNIIFYGILLGLVFGFVSYVASNNLIVAVMVFVATLFLFAFSINKRFKRLKVKLDRFNECYHFINDFVVSLSIKGSISASLEHCFSNASDSLFEVEDSIHELTEKEKVFYLKRYFKFDSYSLFSDLVFMWSEEGGDILDITRHVIDSLRNEEEFVSFCLIESKKALLEFSVMWAFSLFVLFILRFVLSNFYHLLTKQAFFPFAIGGVFLIVLTSIEIMTRRIAKIDIKGWIDEK